MEVYAILFFWLSVNESLIKLPAEGPVTVTGRHAEVPPCGLPQSVRHKAGGKQLHQAAEGSNDRQRGVGYVRVHEATRTILELT